MIRKIPFLFLLWIISVNRGQENGKHISNILGQNATISCPLQEMPYKVIKLMFSSSEKANQKVYRGKYKKRKSHEIPMKKYKKRVEFRAESNKHSFILQNLQPGDEGIYDCIIVPQRGPSVNTETKLIVVTPPTSVVLTDSEGREVSEITGPYNEKEVIEFICDAYGGKPPPKIYWYKNDKLIKYGMEHNIEKASSILRIGPLSRKHASSYHCAASNHLHSVVRSKLVQVDINTLPTNLKIVSDEHPLLAGRTYEIKCVVTGSKPPAVFTWTLDKRILYNFSVFNISENKTGSILTLETSELDDGKKLQCYGKNPAFEKKPLEALRILSIHYAPKVTLSFHPKSVHEGDTVKIHCKIKSYPPADEVFFYKGHEKLHHIANILTIKKRSMTIVKTTTDSSGRYTCIARNIIGVGYSEPESLRFKSIPQCRTPYNTLGVRQQDSIVVNCSVESWPPVTHFHWQFNHSGEITNLNGEHTSDGLTSMIKYTPKNDKDFGNLLCWAQNVNGKMHQPCVYSIIEIDIPDILKNCIHVNSTSDTIYVVCIPGHNGGIDQNFSAHLFDTTKGIRINRVISSTEPKFFIEKLSADTMYLFSAYSWNSQGYSESIIIQANTTSTGSSFALGSIFFYNFIYILAVPVWTYIL